MTNPQPADLDVIPVDVVPVEIVDGDLKESPNWPSQPSSGCRNLAIGCGVAAVLLLVIAIGIAIYVAFYWRDLLADFTLPLAEQTIQKSELPEEGKERLRKRFRALAEDFKTGKLTFEQMKRIVDNVGESPLLVIALVMGTESKYIAPSGLDAEEKKAAHRTLERAARGVFERKIAQQQQERIMDVLMEPSGNGQKKLKEKLSDDEVRELLSRAKAAADASGIPDEPFEVDIAQEIEKAIDAAQKAGA